MRELLLKLLALLTGMQMRERVPGGRASARITHHRLRPGCSPRYLEGGSPDPAAYALVSEEVSHNLVTHAGRDFMHAQCYSAAPGANGLNYIGVSNDAVSETTASTTLSNEIAANGLSRAAGAVAHTANTAITTVTKTFTATGAQSAQKAALFTAASGGTMNHVLAFTQRALLSGDTLTLTFTITLG